MTGSEARTRAVRSLRAYAPELASDVSELGSGLDNTAFRAGDLIVRVTDGGTVAREARLLDVLGPLLPLPIPAPRFADVRNGVLAYPHLPGRSLLGRTPPPGSPPALARFLRDLHAVDADVVKGLVPVEEADPAEWLEDLEGPPELLDVLHASVPEAAGQRVVTHADLGAEHIVEQDGTLTGIIDWSDAAVTDPALDFSRLYRDFGPAFLAEVLGAYGPLDGEAMPRITFFARCAALEDLAFGRETGRDEYTKAAERSIAWLFV